MNIYGTLLQKHVHGKPLRVSLDDDDPDRHIPVPVDETRGIVTRVEWTNPHVRFYIDVEEDDGSVTNWDLELQSANTLRRNGWTRQALSVGDDVIVDAYMARHAISSVRAGRTLASGGGLMYQGGATSHASPRKAIREPIGRNSRTWSELSLVSSSWWG